jgi:hypothetical protein
MGGIEWGWWMGVGRGIKGRILKAGVREVGSGG